MLSTCELSPQRVTVIARADERSRTWAQTDEFMVADYKPFQVLDGEGLRCSLYVSYCPFNCANCYNKAAQKKTYGTAYSEDLEQRIMADLANPRVAGLTLCGGEPMLSAKHLLPLVRRIRAELPEKTVWCYSGYRWEVLQLFDDERRDFIAELDVLIDGQYIEELRDEGALLPFRGSSNQRLIDVQASLVVGEAVEYDYALVDK
ncbi:anaerobic ribonucleoside-triphosphate reductase activating protein [Corynebacterium cystitidis]|uniref:anaerobic ribonucleoside-triphosphate reductase activating protein n=1 Tax=Corynebacterium cystitidis TaxID=35757 RepID=UPI00211E5323|nr:anaerobic ribonucleoside-triphosphate reductase activating protein [Corynebacterium cystitidis]